MPSWVKLYRLRGLCRSRPRRWLGAEWKEYRIVVGNSEVVLQGKRGVGITAVARIRGGERFPTWTGYIWIGSVVEMKKKKPAVHQSDAQHIAAMESNLFAKLEPLVAHCAVTKYDDSDPRKPGWWTVKTMGAAWVVEVKDPDTCSRLVVVQQTLDDALTLASVLLESEEAPWEPDPWLAQAQARGRKK